MAFYCRESRHQLQPARRLYVYQRVANSPLCVRACVRAFVIACSGPGANAPHLLPLHNQSHAACMHEDQSPRASLASLHAVRASTTLPPPLQFNPAPPTQLLTGSTTAVLYQSGKHSAFAVPAGGLFCSSQELLDCWLDDRLIHPRELPLRVLRDCRNKHRHRYRPCTCQKPSERIAAVRDVQPAASWESELGGLTRGCGWMERRGRRPPPPPRTCSQPRTDW